MFAPCLSSALMICAFPFWHAMTRMAVAKLIAPLRWASALQQIGHLLVLAVPGIREQVAEILRGELSCWTSATRFSCSALAARLASVAARPVPPAPPPRLLRGSPRRRNSRARSARGRRVRESLIASSGRRDRLSGDEYSETAPSRGALSRRRDSLPQSSFAAQFSSSRATSGRRATPSARAARTLPPTPPSVRIRRPRAAPRLIRGVLARYGRAPFRPACWTTNAHQ